MRNKKYLDLVKDVETTLSDFLGKDSVSYYCVENFDREALLIFKKSEEYDKDNKLFTGYELFIGCHVENSKILQYGKLIVFVDGDKISIERDGLFKHIETFYGVYEKNLLNADQIREIVFSELEEIKKYAYVRERVNYKDIIEFKAGLKLTGKEMETITFDEIDEIISLLPQIETITFFPLYEKTLKEFCNGDEQKYKILDDALLGRREYFIKYCVEYKFLENIAIIYPSGSTTEYYYTLNKN